MLAVLKRLQADYGATYVRAEFEAEGLRIDELLRLKDISIRAGCDLSLKIGGCEGVRDLIESKVIGAQTIVAPMIESAFALQKYDQASRKVYSPEETENTKFWFNLESKSAVAVASEILGSQAASHMDAAVIERVDLCSSFGKGPDDVDDADICDTVSRIVSLAKHNGIKTVLGGGVSMRSTSFIEGLISDGKLDYYETRKVGFTASGFSRERYATGLLLGLGFEICFLKNKIQNTRSSSERDLRRLTYLDMTYWHEVKHYIPTDV